LRGSQTFEAWQVQFIRNRWIQTHKQYRFKKQFYEYLRTVFPEYENTSDSTFFFILSNQVHTSSIYTPPDFKVDRSYSRKKKKKKKAPQRKKTEGLPGEGKQNNIPSPKGNQERDKTETLLEKIESGNKPLPSKADEVFSCPDCGMTRDQEGEPFRSFEAALACCAGAPEPGGTTSRHAGSMDRLREKAVTIEDLGTEGLPTDRKDETEGGGAMDD